MRLSDSSCQTCKEERCVDVGPTPRRVAFAAALAFAFFLVDLGPKCSMRSAISL